MKPLDDVNLLDPYVRRDATALDVINACDVLVHAGFTFEALAVLHQVLKGSRAVHYPLTAAQARYEEELS